MFLRTQYVTFPLQNWRQSILFLEVLVTFRSQVFLHLTSPTAVLQSMKCLACDTVSSIFLACMISDFCFAVCHAILFDLCFFFHFRNQFLFSMLKGLISDKLGTLFDSARFLLQCVSFQHPLVGRYSSCCHLQIFHIVFTCSM